MKKKSKTLSPSLKPELLVALGLCALFAFVGGKIIISGFTSHSTSIPVATPPVEPTQTQAASPSATRTPTNELSQTPTISVINSIPTVDCIGPDGKHLKLTQKDCDNFNHAWNPTKAPTATPNPQSSFKPPTFPAAKPPPAFPSPGITNNSVYEEIISHITPSWQPLPNQ